MLTRQEVARFLAEFKTAIEFGFGPRWRKRGDERKAHMTGLEITQGQAAPYLKALTPDNYVKGPDPDDYEPEQDVWVFGMDVEGTEAYIKVSLHPDPRKRTVVNAIVWSFHAAEFPIKYPLREAK